MRWSRITTAAPATGPSPVPSISFPPLSTFMGSRAPLLATLRLNEEVSAIRRGRQASAARHWPEKGSLYLWRSAVHGRRAVAHAGPPGSRRDRPPADRQLLGRPLPLLRVARRAGPLRLDPTSRAYD